MRNCMAEAIFFDTWAWLSLVNKREKKYPEIKALFSKTVQSGIPIYTTDYVLDESITIIFKRIGPSLGKEAVHLILDAKKEGFLNIERITIPRFEKSIKMRMKLLDKPTISFTDLTSMVAMQDLGIKQIATADSHFQHVGMDFKIVP
jgi:predicted nucleic acid-binding protein